jgi:hypothetical protein
MPDIECIVQSIRQHHFMRFCGVSPEKFAYDWMVNSRDAGIGIDYSFQSFTEWVGQHA